MINNILVPMDLSGTISPHVNYALNLAKRLKARLTLLQSYPIYPQTVPTSGFGGVAAPVASPIEPIDKERIRQNTENKLREVPGIQEIHYELIVLPYPEQTILSNLQDELNSDLIVLNGEDATDLEVFFGTKPEMLSRKAKCSTLIVPEGFEYKPYQKIGLALDEGEAKEDVSLDDLLQFMTSYTASLEAFHVTDKSADELSPAQSEIYSFLKQKMLEKNITNFNYHTVMEDDINEGMNHFIDSKKIDLLVLLYRDHGFFKRIFNPGIRKQMINQAGVPTLILK